MWMWLLVPVGYLIGSVSAAIIICRCLRLPDPRDQGSGNPGATNVLRYGGKKAAGLTLFADLLKGAIPVVMGIALGASDEIVAAAGAAAFLGHVFPVFYGFKGGKGVSTGCGAFFGFNFFFGLSVFGSWVVLAKINRISSLSSVITAGLCPLYAHLFLESTAYVVASVFISVGVLMTHRSNIQRLLAGEERQIGS